MGHERHQELVDCHNNYLVTLKIAAEWNSDRWAPLLAQASIFVVHCKLNGSGVLGDGQRRFRNCSSRTPGEYFSLIVRCRKLGVLAYLSGIGYRQRPCSGIGGSPLPDRRYTRGEGEARLRFAAGCGEEEPGLDAERAELVAWEKVSRGTDVDGT